MEYQNSGLSGTLRGEGGLLVSIAVTYDNILDESFT